MEKILSMIDMEHQIPIVLSIAGSDSIGGAGIQADIKTCCRFGVYAATALTAVTAQNSIGVTRVEPVSPGLLRDQLKAILDDVIPDAIKIGMTGSVENIVVISDIIKEYGLHKTILDPVLLSTSGTPLCGDVTDAAEAMKECLFPHIFLLTPNLPEAECFGDSLNRCRNVLLKGGHASGNASVDCLSGQDCGQDDPLEFSSVRIDSNNTHGTGCTLSSAIACGLACGRTLNEAVADAKKFLTEAIGKAKDNRDFKGHGPLYFF